MKKMELVFTLVIRSGKIIKAGIRRKIKPGKFMIYKLISDNLKNKY